MGFFEFTPPVNAPEPKAPVVDSCGSCRFWLPYKNVGECRRYPPVVYSDGCQDIPSTSSDYWCGEYERKAA